MHRTTFAMLFVNQTKLQMSTIPELRVWKSHVQGHILILKAKKTTTSHASATTQPDSFSGLESVHTPKEQERLHRVC
jgi:hypothetical protein